MTMDLAADLIKLGLLHPTRGTWSVAKFDTSHRLVWQSNPESETSARFRYQYILGGRNSQHGVVPKDPFVALLDDGRVVEAGIQENCAGTGARHLRLVAP